MKTEGAKNNLNNKTKISIASICFILLLLLWLIAFGGGNILIPVADDVALAATTVPAMNLSLVPYKHGEIQSVSNKIIVNISDPNVWMSTASANANQSIFGQMALSFDITDHKYTVTKEVYKDAGVTLQNNGRTYEEDSEPQQNIGYGSFINTTDNALSSIYVTGTTWYGKSVTNFDILSNGGANVVAGNYIITKVVVSKYKSPAHQYIQSKLMKTYNCVSQSDEGDPQEPIIQYQTIVFSETNCEIILPEQQRIRLFLMADIDYGEGLEGIINNNLRITSVYDGETNWDSTVIVYDSNITGVTAQDGGTGVTNSRYYYSYNNSTDKKDFGLRYGTVENAHGIKVNLTYALSSGYGNLGQHLKISWYSDSECRNSAEDDGTRYAGRYYLRLEVDENDDWEYEFGGDKYHLLNFKFGGNDYLQIFEVNKKVVKISLKDSIGIGFERNENVIETDYVSPYAQALIPYSKVQALISSVTADSTSVFYNKVFYEQGNSSDSFAATGDTRLSSKKTYYLNAGSIGNVVKNLVRQESDWIAIGGCSADWNAINGNGVFGFVGSIFPGYDIKSYSYIYLNIYFGVSGIGANYDFDLGEYNNSEWVSYSEIETNGQTRQIMSDQTPDLDSALKTFIYYDSFAIVSPRINISLSDFQSMNEGIPYGSVFSSEEIDFSLVKLTGGSAYKPSEDVNYYNISTGESNWRIKVIGKMSEITVDTQYNYIYVLMKLGKPLDDDDSPSNVDYQDKNGNYFSPYNDTLYGGFYYVIYSVYSKLMGSDTPIVEVNGISKGKVEVKNANNVGIASVYLESPAPYIINKVALYLEILNYCPDKYYDGSRNVRRSSDSSAIAEAVVRQKVPMEYTEEYAEEFERDPMTLSPYIRNLGFNNIFEYDLANYLQYTYTVTYETMLASDENQRISSSFALGARQGSLSEAERLKNDCYDLDLVLYYNGMPANDDVENGGIEHLEGKIMYRTIQVGVLPDPQRITDPSDINYLEADYHRSYNKETYVAIRVARYSEKNFAGKTLLQLYNEDENRIAISSGLEYYADLYYFYNEYIETDYPYYFYSELPGIFTGRCYVFLELSKDENNDASGFVTYTSGSNTGKKDGFAWDNTSNKTIDFFVSPETESKETFDQLILIDWNHAITYDVDHNELEAVFNLQTTAGKYWLPLIESTKFINYNFIINSNSNVDIPIYFEITKIVLSASEVFNIDGEDNDKGRYITYGAEGNLSKVCTSDTEKAFVKMTSHPEYQSFLENYPVVNGVVDFSSCVQVERFWLPYSDELLDDNPWIAISSGRIPIQEELDVSVDERIQQMVFAGWYYVKISSPETDNYKSVNTHTMICVHRKEVSVYTTLAIRSYMETYEMSKEVKVDISNTRKKELTEAQLEKYTAYIDINTFEIYFNNNNFGEKVYLYYSYEDEDSKIVDTSLIHIYYVGFAGEDKFEDGDREATVTINNDIFRIGSSYVDKAGRYDIVNGNRIINVSGASKQNYKFNYSIGTLYVKPQTLIMNIRTNQKVTYSGEALAPNNHVVNEEGESRDNEKNVIHFIAAYYAYNTLTEKYDILVYDYDQEKIVEAQISIGPEDERDYYYYFEEFYDYDGTPIEVYKVGTELFFDKEIIIAGQDPHIIALKVYESGSELFYYKDNDRRYGKTTIAKEKTYIYKDATGFYYYLKNDSTTEKNYFSENIEPDFNIEENGTLAEYVDIVDGYKIYIGINEAEEAILSNNVVNVFYYDSQENKRFEGGYILKVYAEPSKGSNNYRRTGSYVVFFKIDVLTVYLSDNSKTYNETVLNPVFEATFNDNEYVLGGFDEFFEGRSLLNEKIGLVPGWATVEIETDNNIPQFAKMVSREADFKSTSLEKFAKYQKVSDETDTTVNETYQKFIKATHSTDKVLDAAMYVILLKVTIKNDYSTTGQASMNMRDNIRFASGAAVGHFNNDYNYSFNNGYQAYVIMYLVIDRSSNITVIPYQFDENGHIDEVSEEDFGDGAYLLSDKYYVKTYDGEALSMDVMVTVSDFSPKTQEQEEWQGDSSNGQIINVAEFISSTPNYTEGYVYFKKSNGTKNVTWVDHSGVLSLIHANTFYIIIIVNYDDPDDDRLYNNNYTTLISIYQIKILPRNLSVNIHTGIFDEAGKEYGWKNYGQKNSDVVNQFTITFGDGDPNRTNDFIESDEDLRNTISDLPVIDWEYAALAFNDPDDPSYDPQGQKVSAGDYFLYTKEGTEPSRTINGKKYIDYLFIRPNGFPFKVRMLELNIGGDRNPRVDIATSGEYIGDIQSINIERYGYDGADIAETEFTKLIPRASYPSYLQREIGDYVLMYYYVGPISDYNPDTHTREYFNNNRKFNGNEEIGGPAFDIYIQNHVNGVIQVEPVDVGYYLYYVVIPDSTNYKGVNVGYWIYEVEKTELILKFYDVQSGTTVRGKASRTYNGDEGGYPDFYVEYSGMRGNDNFGNAIYSGSEAIVKYKTEVIEKDYITSTNFGLLNPLYMFVDKNGVILNENGREMLSPQDNAFKPVDAGIYYIAVVFDTKNNEYGWAKNYYITVEYEQDEFGNNLYPQMEITKRLVGVKFEEDNNKITKIYDGTDKVKAGTVNPVAEGNKGNYTFTRASGDIGLIVGDKIELNINYTASKYLRSTVLDENGKETDITVLLSVETELIGEDSGNYLLVLDSESNLSSIEILNGVPYVSLIGKIDRATATVRFYNENGQPISGKRVVTYNGLPQPAIVRVFGVGSSELFMEKGDFVINYSSDNTNYNNEEPPKECDSEYKVKVTITNSNYNESPQTGYMEIEKADVDIEFRGDGVQMYGNITKGLDAIAKGLEGYELNLSVQYYEIDSEGNQGNFVPEISKAPAGQYLAVANYKATANYKDKRATEIFTISNRDVYIVDDVFSNIQYSGMSVDLKIYFVDNGNNYYPQLLFDRLENGKWTPDNYIIDENGNVTINHNPSDVGEYRVRPYEWHDNFHIVNSNWRQFSIEKAELIVQVDDLTINEGGTISMNAKMKNCLTNDNISNVISGLQYKFYNSVTNELISGIPTQPGTYKVIGYGGVSRNYNITYQFGLLTINKTTISVSVGEEEGEKINIVIEGSFAADMSIIVSEVTNTDYSAISDTFENFKLANEEFSGYSISKVYVFEYMNYTKISENAKTKIKLYVPELLSSASNAAWADESQYYVAILGADNELKIETANMSSDGYLSFETDEAQIKAVSVLTIEAPETNSLDWLLYVGIALGVLLIAIAIAIVVKKA